MIPLVPPNVSPMTSNGALVNPPNKVGKPAIANLRSTVLIVLIYFNASAPASNSAYRWLYRGQPIRDEVETETVYFKDTREKRQHRKTT